MPWQDRAGVGVCAFLGNLKMKLKSLWAALALVATLAGCASPPQAAVDVSGDFMTAKNAAIGIVMTPVPKADTQFPGAGCLLCMATASLANSSLTTYVQTLPTDDLTALKSDFAKLLESKGFTVRIISEPLEVKNLPDSKSTTPNTAKQDFTALKAKYGVEKLLVINVSQIGVTRPYSAYVSVGDPKAALVGTGYIVNLSTNALEWYLPVNVVKGADHAWDEPPKFPGLENAYFQVIEMGKEAFTKPFSM